jgi:hypothetical protein
MRPDTLFTNCQAPQGGAIYADPTSSVTATRCDFVGNSANIGGAYAAGRWQSQYIPDATAKFVACKFQDNSASTHYGGAIYLNIYSAVTLERSLVLHNYGPSGGGIYADGTSRVGASAPFPCAPHAVGPPVAHEGLPAHRPHFCYAPRLATLLRTL